MCVSVAQLITIFDCSYGFKLPLGLVPEETMVAHSVLEARSFLPRSRETICFVVSEIAELECACSDGLIVLI